MEESTDTGLWLEISDLSAPFNMGVTLGTFKMSGTISVSRDKLNIWHSGIYKCFAEVWTNLTSVGIWI